VFTELCIYLELLKDWVFFRNIQKMHPPRNGRIKKLMVPSEIATQGLSNEWSCQHASTILNIFCNFCDCPALGDRSHHQALKNLQMIIVDWLFLVQLGA
jgi:hypothetical protein